MQHLTQRFGKPLFFCLFFFLIFNANGQLISAKMEKDFRDDARIKVAKVVQFVNKGVEKYEKTGPQAFVEYLGQTVSEVDKKFIIKELKGLPPLPRLKMDDHNVVFFHKNKIIAEFDSYDVAQGLYQNKDIDLFYDTSLSFQENFESWKKPSKKDSESSASIFWNNLIIPQAEARMTNKAAIPLMIGVPIVAAIVGYFLGKSANKAKVAENRTLLGDPSPSAPGAGHAHGHGTDNLAGGGTAEPEGKSPAASPGKATKHQASGATVDTKPASGTTGGSSDSAKIISDLENKYKKCQGIQDAAKKRECAQNLYFETRMLLDTKYNPLDKPPTKEEEIIRKGILALRAKIKNDYPGLKPNPSATAPSNTTPANPNASATPAASQTPPDGVSSNAPNKPVFVDNSVKRDLRDTTPTFSPSAQPIGGSLTVINGGSDNIAPQKEQPSPNTQTASPAPSIRLTLDTVSPTPSGKPIGDSLTVINGGRDNIAPQKEQPSPNTQTASPAPSSKLTLETASPTPSGSFTLGTGAPSPSQTKNPPEVKIFEPGEKDKVVRK